MSIDVPTELLTASSGSVGDTVFSRNQHGPYTRPRTVPTDPATLHQVAVRNALTECVTAWNAELTQDQRDAWDVFALNVQLRTALGRATNASGLAMYIRANVPRIQQLLGATPRVDVAPTSFTAAPFTPITRVVLNVIDNTIHPFFAESDSWVTEPNAAMLFYASRPQPLTRNFWNGPYRIAGNLKGIDPTLSSPGTILLPFPAVLGQRVFVRGRLTLPDARISNAFRLPADTVAQVAPLPLVAVFVSIAPARALIHIAFDSLIRRQAHFPGNFANRFANTIWTTTAVSTIDTVLTLSVRLAALNPGPNQVVFTPPPFDVNGLLTGLSVQPFTIPLV